MDNHDLLHSNEWTFLSKFGLHHPFFVLQADTLTSTYIILLLIFIISLYVHRCLKNPQSLVRYCALQYAGSLRDLVKQSMKDTYKDHASFIAALFTFIFMCNTIQIIPGLEEPTKDLNTTLALGLISFFYVHIWALKTHGLKHYMLGYLEPFSIMLPLNIVGSLTSIISLSFRLFGNIFGGFIITSLYARLLSGSILLQSFALFSGLNIGMFLVFGFFEGLIQAFVFAMLTLTYLSMEIVAEEEEEEELAPKTPNERNL